MTPDNANEEIQALWTPSQQQIDNSNLSQFIAEANKSFSLNLQDFDALHQWSVDSSADFWKQVWDFTSIKAEIRGDEVISPDTSFINTKFFPDARLNYAENMLRRNDNSDAIVFRGENRVSSRLSWAELSQQVAQFAEFLRQSGVKENDRVAAAMPNIPQTVVAMLATTSIGAVWSSCSAEFGVQGVMDRFGQIEPTVLIICDGYYFNGKRIDFLEKAKSIIPQLPSLSRVVLVPYAMEGLQHGLTDIVLWDDALASGGTDAQLQFAQVPFDHPLFIMFSSGTTGKPKCIVHSVGGSLIQHLKEHQLHCDIKPGDRVFYFTTCSWMMWNWLVSALASEATLMLYDGSPFSSAKQVLFDFVEQEKITFFGISAKYLDAVKKAGLIPKDSHDLSSIRMIASTGSPLLPDSYDFVYKSMTPGICLASMSGGTDILSCFVLGNPIGPVYRGEIQARALGMAVEVWSDEGSSLITEKGELVCVAPFPCKPIGFWDDENDVRYKAAYFDRFDDIWCQGDFAEITATGGMIIYGRSDAVLNPGGVRIGTAEIYRQVEKLDEVIEAIAIGQDYKDDVRVILFVILRDGLELDRDLIQKIKQKIRIGASPRHVPAVTLQVPEIPRTTSGKIVELAVKDVVHGREVKNVSALANPEALIHFKNRLELKL